MPPDTAPDQPPEHRQPLPRHRVSVDGISSQPFRRPIISSQDRRPVLTGRPHQSPAPGPQPAPVPQPLPPPGNSPAIPLPPVPQQSAPTAPPTPVTPPVPQAPIPSPTPATPASQPPVLPTPPATMAFQPPAPAAPAGQPAKARRRIPWRRVLLIAGSIAAAAVLIAIAALLWQRHSNQSNPATVFKAAIDNSYQTRQLEAVTTAGAARSDASFDYSSPKNLQMSTDGTIVRYGASYPVRGYGSAKDSYFSYTGFPATTPANISAIAQGGWVHVRVSGVLPPRVGNNIAYLADPRYQAFGPLVFGNFDAATRAKMVQYVTGQQLYAYNVKQVTHATIQNQKVLIYPVKVNVGYLKVLNLSAASNEGFAPADIQAALNNLDPLKSATLKIYVATGSRRIVRLDVTLNGQTTTTVYGNYNHATVADEPQTKLQWPDFAAVQLQIDLSAANAQSAGGLDTMRQSALAAVQTFVDRYYQVNSYYPAYANMNDANWLATSMAGLDQDNLRDPLGKNWLLTIKPQAGNYSYRVSTAAGKSCDNNTAIANAQICSQYTLSAMPSSGKPYSVASN